MLYILLPHACLTLLIIGSSAIGSSKLPSAEEVLLILIALLLALDFSVSRSKSNWLYPLVFSFLEVNFSSSTSSSKRSPAVSHVESTSFVKSSCALFKSLTPFSTHKFVSSFNDLPKLLNLHPSYP